MKKLIACVILSFLMILTLAFTAFAAETLTASLSGTASAKQGETITVDVTLTADSVKSILVSNVSFNDDVFEFVSGKWLIDGALSDFNIKDMIGAWGSSNEIKANGKIVSLTFKVLESAPRGSQEITAKVSINTNEATADVKYTVTVGCSHKFDKKNIEAGFLASAATCKDKATYYYACSVCGEKGTETFTDESSKLVDHKYDTTKYKNDKDKHWYECTVCQAKKDETVHTPGAEATATAPQICTVCKYELKPIVTGHTHNTWSETWEKDATNHWHKCTTAGCTEKKDSAVHVYANDCDKTCDTCGYVRTITHKYSDKYSSDTKNHWYECSVCKDKKDSAEHKAGAAATATKNQTCTVCGYVIKKATGHTHDVSGSSWKSNSTKHWKLCSCGEKIDQASHKWDSGTVKTEATIEKEGEKVFACTVCKAEKIEKIAKLDPPDTTVPDDTTLPDDTTEPDDTTVPDDITDSVGTTGPVGTTVPVFTAPSDPSSGNGGSNVGTIIIVIVGIVVLLAAAAAVVLLIIGDSKSKSRRR